MEVEIVMDLEDNSLHDYLLDQGKESVTPWGTSRPPISSKVPYKQMPNFGNSEIGQSRSLLFVFRTDMDCEVARPNHIDSLLTQAPRVYIYTHTII